MRLQNEEGLNTTDVDYFKTFKEKHYAGHKKCPTVLSWNKDGTLLATCQMVVKLWNFHEEVGLEKSSQTKGNDNIIQNAQFWGNNLLGTLSRESLRFWDIREANSMKSNRVEKRTKSDLVRFCFNHSNSTEGLKFALVNKESNVLVYDYRNTNVLLATVNPKPLLSMEVSTAQWDNSDSLLFLAGGENSTGSLLLIDAQTYEPIPDAVLTTHCAKITDIAFNNNNNKLATASEDSLIEIHQVPDLICERVFSNKSDSSFKNISFSYNGKYIAASCDSNSIDIYNVQKGGQAYKLKCSNGQQSLSWHPKKMVLAYLDDQDKKRSLDRGEDVYVHLFLA